MSDTYPRIPRKYRLPSAIPNLWKGGWENEAAARVYLEFFAYNFDITRVANLDVLFEAKMSRSDELVRFGDPKVPHILEVKSDLRKFLTTIGPDGSEHYEGIRTDDEAYEAHNVAWPSILFAGTDKHDDRPELERKYPGVVIVADQDAPKGVPSYSEFQSALAWAFEAEHEDR